MHKRQRLILSLGLALAAGLLAWRLGAEWQRANLRYESLSGPAARPIPALLAPPPHDPPPTDEVVAENLFSPDRTNEIAAREVPQRQPPVPIILGTMKLGPTYEALMSEGGTPAERAFRRVKPGEQLGSFTVVEIRDETVVIEYQGQRTTLDVYQSARSVAPPPARTTRQAAPVVVESGAAPARPGAPAASQPNSPPARAPAAQQPAGPPGVRVTIEGNRKRLERDTPFGVQTWYEPLEQ